MADNGCSSYELGPLITQLTQGFDKAKQLKARMGPEVSGETKGMLLAGILSSYEKSLEILKYGGSMDQSQQHVVPSTCMPGSPLSANGSPKSDDMNSFSSQQESRDLPRKRRMLPSWTDQVKVSSDKALDGAPDDGYSWRKYGQKDILGAKHPRSYYRCTYRTIQGCWAIKQVQRNDEDPSVVDITYKGTHTCTPGPRTKSAPTSPNKQQKNKHDNTASQYQQQPNMLLNFQTGLTVDTQNRENQETGFPFSTSGSGYENHTYIPSTLGENNFCSFPTSFLLSPATSESTYFSTSPCKMSTFGEVYHGQNSESDITEIISAATSGTNSPIVGLDFAIDQLELNPSFPYDDQAFFSSFSQAKE